MTIPIPTAAQLTPENIAATRKALGMTQLQLSGRCGQDYNIIQVIEGGHRTRLNSNRKRIAAELAQIANEQQMEREKKYSRALDHVPQSSRRMFMPALGVIKRDQPKRAQGAINPATGKPLIDLSEAPSNMETQK